MLSRKRFLHSFIACVALGGVLGGTAHANDLGTPAEAEAMVHKAIAYIKANGPDKSYAEFTNGTSFKDRNLYVSVYDMAGNNLAHGANPKLVGKNLIELKDPNGVEIIKMQLAIATEKGKGWSKQFQFINPTTKALQDKVNYVERSGDIWVCVGYYK